MAGISKLASDFCALAVLLRWHSSRAQMAFTLRGRKFCALARRRRVRRHLAPLQSALKPGTVPACRTEPR